MPNYEYYIVTIAGESGRSPDGKAVNDVITKMANAGWELVSQVSPNRGEIQATFKREKNRNYPGPRPVPQTVTTGGGCCLVPAVALTSLLVLALSLFVSRPWR